MPELPEVETIVRDLRPHIINRTILEAQLFSPSQVKSPSAEEFCRALKGRRIFGATRRGKYILLALDGPYILAFHLMMSGSLTYQANPDVPGRFTRAILSLNGQSQLRFDDPRRLGRLWLVEEESAIVGKLGPEPLERAFSLENLVGALKKRRAPIKALLLDQNLLAGVGNIYADEALFRAGIFPERAAYSLSQRELSGLYNAIKETLEAGIINRGTTFQDYRDGFGHSGRNQGHLKVFRREGKPCPSCGEAIKKKVIRGRSSFYCPRCQN